MSTFTRYLFLLPRLTAALVAAAMLLVAARAELTGAQIPVDTGSCMPSLHCLAAQPAFADVNSTPAHLHEIFHADGTKVGEIFVARSGDESTYVEHWVMFDNYFYPSVIKPAKNQLAYTSEQDFLARVPFGKDSRYARWDVVERTRIPGR